MQTACRTQRSLQAVWKNLRRHVSITLKRGFGESPRRLGLILLQLSRCHSNLLWSHEKHGQSSWTHVFSGQRNTKVSWRTMLFSNFQNCSKSDCNATVKSQNAEDGEMKKDGEEKTHHHIKLGSRLGQISSHYSLKSCYQPSWQQAHGGGKDKW